MADAVTTPEAAAPAAAATNPAAASPASAAQPNVVNVHYPPVAGTVTPPPAGPAPLPTTVIEQLQAYGALQARVSQMEAENRARETAAQAEQVRLLTEKGQVDAALALTRETAKRDLDAALAAKAAIEESSKRFALDGELARALSGHNLVKGGAGQLTELWRSKFVAEHKNGTVEVRSAQTFEPVGAVIGAMLGLPEYAHYLLPTTQGGVGAPGASSTTATPPATTPATHVPATGGEALVLKALEARMAMGPNPQLTGGTSPQGQAMAAAGFGLYAPLQQAR